MKMNNRFAFATSIIFFFLLSSPAWAQQPVIQDDSLYSAILKEQRTIKIISPKNYQPGSTDTFDMLYVLDGEWNTSLAEKVHGFLAYAEFIPANMIIVSIPNLYREEINLRDRDFTPTSNKNNQLSGGALAGGANNFLAFLEDELIPYITNKYPVKIENSTLYGTSLGGLFAIYAFLHKPTLFKSYLTVEPSLWWDDKYIHQIAPKKLPVICRGKSKRIPMKRIFQRYGKKFTMV